MVKDFDISGKPAAQLVGREILAAAGALLLYPFGLWKSGKRTPRQAEQRTVVLVHGYLSNASSLLPLKTYLRTRGIRNCLSYQYQVSDGIETAARGLKEFLKRHVRGGRVDLVCHSLGGVISRVYLQDLGGARRVDRCITLGTPHRGTYNAYWVPSRVGLALRPDSNLMARLQTTRVHAHGVHFCSVVAGSDNIVIPRVYARDEDELVHVPHVGHLGMLFSPAVFRAVADRLQGQRAK